MRLLLAALCIGSTITLTSWAEHVLHIAVLIAVLFLLSEHHQAASRLCWRNWQLLRWILIPTLLLHAIFTPGALIFPHFFLPISHEGVQLGLNLALHWADIFTLAMLLGRLFPIQQWVLGITHIPWLDHRLYPYLCLFPRMNLLIRALIRQHYRQWNHLPWRHPIHKIAQLPPHILNLLLQMQAHSRRCAKYIWEHWEQGYQAILSHVDVLQSQRFPHSIALILLSIWINIGVFH